MATAQSIIVLTIDPIDFWRQVHRCHHAPTCRRCCWPWRSTPAGQYGQVAIGHQRYLVHRLVLELTNGAMLLPGILACHTCDNPPCCNPHHLYPGTYTDNARDQFIHGAYAPARCADYANDDRKALQAWLQLTERHTNTLMLQNR